MGLLAPSANNAKKFEKARASISGSGLWYPLFCYGPIDQLSADRRRWAMQRLLKQQDVFDLEGAMRIVHEESDTHWMVQVGNNRYAAALALGFTHISASLWPQAQLAARSELANKCRAQQW